MENKTAKIISYVFHPLLIPTYTFILLLSMNAYFASSINFQGKLYILFFLFISTAFFPAISTFILYKRKLISSYHLEKREDRNIPYILTIIFYYATYYMLHSLSNNGLSAIFFLIMLATTLLIIIVFFINLKFKISIHCMSIGALSGILIGISYRFQTDILISILLSFLISGFVGYSRLTLNAHRPSEVYFGYLLGFGSMLGMLMAIR